MEIRDTWPQDCIRGEFPGDKLTADATAIRNQKNEIVYPIKDGVTIVLPKTTGNNAAVAEFYNGNKWRRFKIFEELFYLMHGGKTRVLQEFMQYLPELSDSRFLNVAIGEGNTHALTPKDCEVYGVDISEGQLAICRDRFPNSKLRLFQAEAEHLPFEDNSFDHAMTAGAINFFNDPRVAIAELIRVTKPGGYILISDESPTMANKYNGTRIGRWFLSQSLGKGFSKVVEDRTTLKTENLAVGLFENWKIYDIWRKGGYCIIGRVPQQRASVTSQKTPLTEAVSS